MTQSYKIAEAFVEFNARDGGFNAAMQRAEAQTSSFRQALTRTQYSIAPLMVAAGAAAFAIGAAFVRAAKSASDLQDAAAGLGTTADYLDRLRYAAKFVGVEAGSVDAGLRELRRTLGEMATGQVTGGTKVFQQLAESMGETDLASRPLPVVVARLADAFKRLDVNQRTIAANEIFGRGGGSAFLRMLKDGSAGLDDVNRRMAALGKNFDSLPSNKLDEIDDQIESTGHTILRTTQQFAATIGPIVLPALRYVEEAIAGIGREVLPLAGLAYASLSVLPETITYIGTVINTVFVDITSTIGEFVEYFVKAFKFIFDFAALGFQEVVGYGTVIGKMVWTMAKEGGVTPENATSFFQGMGEASAKQAERERLSQPKAPAWPDRSSEREAARVKEIDAWKEMDRMFTGNLKDFQDKMLGPRRDARDPNRSEFPIDIDLGPELAKREKQMTGAFSGIAEFAKQLQLSQTKDQTSSKMLGALVDIRELLKRPTLAQSMIGP